MKAALATLRLCFVVLFGAMSLLHGPVMTFGAHAAVPAEHRHAAQAGHAAADCHEHGTAPADHGRCNAFACFMAVEPPPVVARPPVAVVFAIMSAARMPELDPVRTTPALPPPRLQG